MILNHLYLLWYLIKKLPVKHLEKNGLYIKKFVKLVSIVTFNLLIYGN